MKHVINWKLFTLLLALSLISIILVFPYLLTVQGEILKKMAQPLALLFIAQFIQSFLLFSLAIFLGLFFTKKIGFRLPLFTALLGEKRIDRKVLKNIVTTSIVSGIITAVIIYVLDTLFTMSGVEISTHESYAPVWQKLLAAFYGGITEEILMRLFFMTFFIWISMKLFKQTKPTRGGILGGIILAALLFGVGHLPITASLTTLNTLVIARAVILNGIGGIVFGWLFWKKGFESAMIAHFTTDIFLLTLLPLLF